jgi:iron complex outermembrane receptor protein
MKLIVLFITVLLLATGPLFSQEEVDTLLVLPQVFVNETVLKPYEEGRDWERMDVSNLVVVQASDLGQLLSSSNGVFIKNYGPAGISSSSLRGGSASHTAILWNGINIQSPMLGQSDFSLLPIALTDEVLISFGGPSTAGIQGAIGGAIQMKNVFNEKAPILKINNSAGNFGAYQNSVRLQLGKKKITSVTRFYHRLSENNFPYLSLQNNLKKLEHARLTQWGIVQDSRFRLSPKSEIDIHLWQQNSQRQLPPNRLQLKSVAEQDDASFRSVIKWKKWTDKHAFLIQSAYVSDQLVYQDSITQVDSDSKANTFNVKASDHYYARFGTFNFSLNYSSIWVNSNNYDKIPVRNQYTAQAAFKKESKNQKWTGNFSLVNSLVNGAVQPLLPSFHLRGKLTPLLGIKAAISRNYRLPTFNDLYWEPGGNPDLNPEKSWNYEAGVEIKKTNKVGWNIHLNAFSRSVDDWILWLPSGAFWQPENAKKVWSRGVDAKVNLSKSFSRWKWNVNAYYGFVKSTNTQASGNSQSSIGKQLIYQPMHSGGMNFQINYKKSSIHYEHRWNGSVFTTRDNSTQLEDYAVGNFTVQRKFQTKKVKSSLSVRVNNIWDNSYEVVEFYPMPGRSFMIQLSTEIN